jgi:predicted RNase H-like HicB family nuclease
MKYTVIIVQSANNYGAYVPDLPGCVATGDTAEQAEQEIREAIEFHLAGMLEDGDPLPVPASRAVDVEVTAPAKGISRAG